MTTLTLDDKKRAFYKTALGYSDAQMATKSLADLEKEYYEGTNQFSTDAGRTGTEWSAISPLAPANDSTPSSGRFTLTLFEIPFDKLITGFKLQVGTVAASGLTLSRFALYYNFTNGRADGSVGALVGGSASDTSGLPTQNAVYSRPMSAETIAGVVCAASYQTRRNQTVGVGILQTGATPGRIRAVGTNPGLGTGLGGIVAQTQTGLTEVPASVTIDKDAQGGAALGWHDNAPVLVVT